ncbi:hypothetical protein [Nocardia asiatica]
MSFPLDIDPAVLVQFDRYRRLCGLDCAIVSDSHDIVVRSWTDVGAVAMPPEVGTAVHARLTDPVPVILVENSVWIMLTGPISSDLREQWNSTLTVAKAATVAADAAVTLPDPRTSGRRWFVPPLSSDRPHPELVFAEIGRFRWPADVMTSEVARPPRQFTSTREAEVGHPRSRRREWISAELIWGKGTGR